MIPSCFLSCQGNGPDTFPSPAAHKAAASRVASLMKHFGSKGWAQDQSLALYVNAQVGASSPLRFPLDGAFFPV